MRIATFIGGIAGAAIGAAVWFWLETGTPPRDASWAPLLVGLLAGVGTRVLAQPVSLPFLRGAVTAIIALLAVMGTRQFITYTVQQQAQALAEKTPLVLDVVEEDVAEDEAEPYAKTAEEELGSEEAESLVDATAAEPPTATTEEEDTASMAVEDLESTAAATMEVPTPAAKSIPSEPVPKPGLGEKPLLVAFYYAGGILLAYFLGKGPALSAPSRSSDSAPPAAE